MIDSHMVGLYVMLRRYVTLCLSVVLYVMHQQKLWLRESNYIAAIMAVISVAKKVYILTIRSDLSGDFEIA